jgi:hypothetical protein
MKTCVAFVAFAVSLGSTLAAQAPVRTAEQRDQRYQISTVERVLEGAVEHGARVTRDRLRAVLPADMLLSEDARVRGYRLDGYGVFFDVAVPDLAGTLPWSFRTLDQNALGLASALKSLRSVIEKLGDENVEQALKRIELEVAPVTLSAPATNEAAAALSGARTFTGSAASSSDLPAAPASSAAQSSSPGPADPIANDPILDDPEEAYRLEVRDALMNAMLDHSAALRLAPSELVTVAARGTADRATLSPVADDSRTIMISMRGADLSAYLAAQLSREEARSRMIVRVF